MPCELRRRVDDDEGDVIRVHKRRQSGLSLLSYRSAVRDFSLKKIRGHSCFLWAGEVYVFPEIVATDTKLRRRQPFSLFPRQLESRWKRCLVNFPEDKEYYRETYHEIILSKCYLSDVVGNRHAPLLVFEVSSRTVSPHFRRELRVVTKGRSCHNEEEYRKIRRNGVFRLQRRKLRQVRHKGVH